MVLISKLLLAMWYNFNYICEFKSVELGTNTFLFFADLFPSGYIIKLGIAYLAQVQ